MLANSITTEQYFVYLGQAWLDSTLCSQGNDKTCSLFNGRVYVGVP